MSETPRTDAEIVTGQAREDFRNIKGQWMTQIKYEKNTEWIFADLARQLEHELAQASKSAFANAVRAETTETKLAQAQARCAELEAIRNELLLMIERQNAAIKEPH